MDAKIRFDSDKDYKPVLLSLLKRRLQGARKRRLGLGPTATAAAGLFVRAWSLATIERHSITTEDSMSTQSESKDSQAHDHQSTHGGTTGSASGSGTGGSGDIGATEGQAANPGNQQSGQQSSQQGTMPPSETDDDQYDQGTVQVEP